MSGLFYSSVALLLSARCSTYWTTLLRNSAYSCGALGSSLACLPSGSPWQGILPDSPSSQLPCRPNSRTPLHLGPASLLCFYLLGQVALTFHICFKAVMQWHQRKQYNLRWSLCTLIKHAISSMSPLSSSLPCLGYGTLKSSWAQVCLPTALREKSEYHSIYFQTDQKQQRVQIWVQNVPSSVPSSHCLVPALYRQHELFRNYPYSSTCS